LPGRVDSPTAQGTNGLIARTMARICRDYRDIMQEKSWATASESSSSGVRVPTAVELYGREQEVYELISSEPVHFDYLIEKTGMTAAELSATLTMLELAGVVSRFTGDWYAREGQATRI
jgi:DNA processing protein